MSNNDEKLFNDIVNPIFLSSDSKSVWILVVDGEPAMRTESIRIMDDEKVKMLSDKGYKMYQHQKELHKMINKLIDNMDNDE